MEIKIDSEELFSLKQELQRCKKELREVEEALVEFEDKKLKEKVLYNSMRLANLYLAGIFRKLGFNVPEASYFMDVINDRHANVRHYLGDTWYVNNRLTVDIDVQITNEFKRAFVNLGIREEKLEEVKDNILQ